MDKGKRGKRAKTRENIYNLRNQVRTESIGKRFDETKRGEV